MNAVEVRGLRDSGPTDAYSLSLAHSAWHLVQGSRQPLLQVSTFLQVWGDICGRTSLMGPRTVLDFQFFQCFSCKDRSYDF